MEQKMSEIAIYTAKDGHVELSVSLTENTLWLTLNQMADLFGKDKSTISRHINNIFKINELERNSVVAKFATTASDGKIYQVEYFNLDAIISVGYRVNSKEGVQFRKWATSVLNDHLIKGYSLNKQRIAERGVTDLEQSISLMQKTLEQHGLVTDIGKETIQLILSYSKSWRLLLEYDEDRLTFSGKGTTPIEALSYPGVIEAISALKLDLAAKGEASDLFGKQRSDALKGILGSVEQSFDGQALYASVEEKAAHLLYFVIKDHPFTDGNKRIGSFLFLLYLRIQNANINLNENGIVALALLVAESDSKQKDLVIKLIMNLLKS